MNIPIAAFKSFIGLGSKIEKPAYDPGAYDLVVLATPVYAGGVPPQVRSYLRFSVLLASRRRKINKRMVNAQSEEPP